MIRWITSFACLAAFVLEAQVGTLTGKITLDGKLDEPDWSRAPKQGDFVSLKDRIESKEATLKTEFSVLTDGKKLWFGIKCFEPEMEKLKKTPPTAPWTTDALEVFFSPSGLVTDYYQFLVTGNNFRLSNFYAEKGKIRPDPYLPIWNSAVHMDKDFWSCEIEIPLTALYMTRRNNWQSVWLFNIARTSRIHLQNTTWSPLHKGYGELERFRRLSGFPIPDAKDDLYLRSAAVSISESRNGTLCGRLKLCAELPIAGAYEFSSGASAPQRVDMETGTNYFHVPCAFDKPGRKELRLTLKRLSDGRLFERFYPVSVQYEPLSVHLTTPGYRNNFYPGQNFSRIEGRADSLVGKTIELTLEGPGIPRQTVTAAKDGSFRFSTPGFQFGTATLRVRCGTLERTVSIRRLPPSGHTMTWIENGCIIRDGKPVFRRNMYAEYYMTSEAFQKRYDRDNLFITRGFHGQRGWIDAFRLMKGEKAYETTQDVMPSKELFDKIDAVIKDNENRDFTHWYLSDEPECRAVSPVYLKYLYDHIAAKDPYHMIEIASRSCSRFIDCADWFETHPYINPQTTENGQRIYGREISAVGSYVEDIARLNRPDKVIGFIPTVFSYKDIDPASDYPRFDELVCHTWAALLGGARTLWPYVYMDMGDRPGLYEGTRYLFSSCAALEDLLLHGKRTTVARTQEYEAALWISPDGRDRMFALVNFTAGPLDVKLSGLNGKFLEFRGTRTFSDFSFRLAAHEVIVGTSRKMDSGLPSLAEVRELVRKQEAERLARGKENLLFDRWKDVEITTSQPSSAQYKMFDGVTDVLAWYQTWGKDKYYEIAFPKFVPEFRRIRIYGAHLDGAVLKIRKHGEWLSPKPSRTENGEYMLMYEYPEKLRTVKLRLEFPKDKIELYEIELLK